MVGGEGEQREGRGKRKRVHLVYRQNQLNSLFKTYLFFSLMIKETEDVDHWSKVMEGESKKATREQIAMATATFRVQCEFLDGLHRNGTKPSTSSLYEAMESINRASLKEKRNVAKSMVDKFIVSDEGNQKIGEALQNAALCAVKAALAARTIYESFRQDPVVREALESKVKESTSSIDTYENKNVKYEKTKELSKIDEERYLSELRDAIGCALLPSDHLRRRLKSFGVTKSGHGSPRLVVASMAALVRTDVNVFLKRFVSESIRKGLHHTIVKEEESSEETLEDNENSEWHWLLGIGSDSTSSRRRLMNLICNNVDKVHKNEDEDVVLQRPSECRRAASVIIGRLAAIGLLAEAQLILSQSQMTCKLAVESMKDDNLHIMVSQDGETAKDIEMKTNDFFVKIWREDFYADLLLLRDETKNQINMFGRDISQYLKLSETIGDRVLLALQEKQLSIAEEEAAQMYSIART